MLQPKLLAVQPLHPLMLRLEYDTGEIKLFDVEPYATGFWFSQLLNPSYFAMVRVLPNGVGIEWPNGQDIAPHELYESSRYEENN